MPYNEFLKVLLLSHLFGLFSLAAIYGIRAGLVLGKTFTLLWSYSSAIVVGWYVCMCVCVGSLTIIVFPSFLAICALGSQSSLSFSFSLSFLFECLCVFHSFIFLSFIFSHRLYTLIVSAVSPRAHVLVVLSVHALTRLFHIKLTYRNLPALSSYIAYPAHLVFSSLFFLLKARSLPTHFIYFSRLFLRVCVSVCECVSSF